MSAKKWDWGLRLVLKNGDELQGKERGEHSRVGGGHGVCEGGVVAMEKDILGRWMDHGGRS